MDINSHISKQSEKLKALGIDNYQQEAEMLLSFVLKKPKEFLYTHPESKLKPIQVFQLKYFSWKRTRGYSIAVITGEKEFYGYPFKVNKHVLIPRPETEMITDLVVQKIAKDKKNKITLIDVGTGSGCIPISIIKELKKKKVLGDDFHCCAVDISSKAIKIAKKNSKLNLVENFISFYQGDLLSPLTTELKHYDRQLVITANLPYLSKKQVKTSKSIKKEPKLALVAGNDGLKYYRRLFYAIKELRQQNIYIICEIDPSQTKNISKLIDSCLPDFNFQIKKDLRGLDRFVIINSLLKIY